MSRTITEKEIELLKNALRNQAGDNLCWIVNDEPVQIPPKAEFLESCARYHAQISGERGELSGCMTIAQLEAALAKEQVHLNWIVGERESAKHRAEWLFRENLVLQETLKFSETKRTATLAHFDNLFYLQMQSTLMLIERDSDLKQEVRSLRTISQSLLLALESVSDICGDSCEYGIPGVVLTEMQSRVRTVIAKAKEILKPKVVKEKEETHGRD